MSASPGENQIIPGINRTTSIHEFRYPRQIDPQLPFIAAKDAPVSTILESTQLVEDLAQKEFRWGEQDSYRERVKATTGGTPSAGLLTVVIDGDDWKQLRKNDLYTDETTGAVFMIDETPSTSSVRLRVWVIPPSGSGVIANGDFLTDTGNAMEEFSGSRSIINKTPMYQSNLIQMFRETGGISGRADRYTYIGVPEAAHQMNILMEKHSRSKEVALFKGLKSEAPGPDGNIITTTAGIDSFMTGAGSRSIVEDLNDQPLVENSLIEILYQVFNKGRSSERWAVTGNNALMWMREWTDEKIRIVNEEAAQKIGIYVTDYRTEFGVLHMLHHPLFFRLGWEDRMYILDLDDLQLRSLPGRGAVRFWENTQPPDRDGTTTDVWCEWGLKMEATEKHALIYGIQKPV